MSRPRITGQLDISLILPVLVGLLYAGTGGWTAERWNTALAVMGLSVYRKSEEAGYVRGYNTYNPDLRLPPAAIEQPFSLDSERIADPDHPRDAHGRFTRKAP